MHRFHSSHMKLITRAAAGKFVGEKVNTVSGYQNVLPDAWYSTLAKPNKTHEDFNGIKRNPTYSSVRRNLVGGARSYASKSGGDGAQTKWARPWTRPLSPHLAIYQPHSNSTSSIANRITGIYLSAAVLAPYLLCLKVGTISFTYDYVYQLFFYSSKFVPLSAELAALALGYHVYKGIGHLKADFTGSVANVKKH